MIKSGIRFLAAGMILIMSASCKSTGETGVTTKKDVFREMALRLAAVDSMLAKKTVAVLGFEMTGREDDSYCKYATEKLTHELVSTGRLTVIERSRIDRVLEELRFNQSGMVNANLAARIGKILAVEGVVIGTISVEGDEVELIARVVQSETAVIMKSADMIYRVETGTGIAVGSVTAPGNDYRPDDITRYTTDRAAANVTGSIILGQFVFSGSEAVTVKYKGLLGNQYDWITLVEETTSDDKYGEWFYTYGKTSGSYTFKNVPPGNYEVRLYYDWPSGGYQVQGRIKITVK
jgi:TolB-like protein